MSRYDRKTSHFKWNTPYGWGGLILVMALGSAVVAPTLSWIFASEPPGRPGQPILLPAPSAKSSTPAPIVLPAGPAIPTPAIPGSPIVLPEAPPPLTVAAAPDFPSPDLPPLPTAPAVNIPNTVIAPPPPIVLVQGTTSSAPTVPATILPATNVPAPVKVEAPPLPLIEAVPAPRPEPVRVKTERPARVEPTASKRDMGSDAPPFTDLVQVGPVPKGVVPPIVPDPIKPEAGPAPRPLVGPGRLPLLADDPAGFGHTPTPSKRELEEYGKFIDSFIDPRNTLDLVLGRTRLMLLKQVPTKTQIADEEIASLNVINPKQVTLIGKKVGTTVLNLWFDDPADPKKEKILSFLVRVIPDPERRARLERVYKALEEEINETFPDSVIHVKLVGDKLVVSGQAHDIVEATQILRIVRANAPPEDIASIPVQNINLAVTPPDDGALPALRDFLTAGGPNVINLIRVPGQQQVMLRVTVAEVNRSAARSIGMNFALFNNNGTQVVANQTGNLGTAGGILGQGLGALTNNIPVSLDNGQITLAINALRTLNYARSLAEPNLVALNGQTATFQAGGQFPVPVIAAGGGFGGGGGGGNLQGVSFVPFGVLLNFTPFVTDKDRIRLNVGATVSTRDLATGANVGGSNVPGLNTRNFQSTVELREGQTLAIAGLIQNNLGAESTRIPFLGDVPILSRLLGFDKITAGEQELVILVTPELVSPLDPKEAPLLPGADIFEPGDLEFYVLGRLESRRSYDYRSPVRNDIHRMGAYRRCEQTHIFGPSGHSEYNLFQVP